MLIAYHHSLADVMGGANSYTFHGYCRREWLVYLINVGCCTYLPHSVYVTHYFSSMKFIHNYLLQQEVFGALEVDDDDEGAPPKKAPRIPSRKCEYLARCFHLNSQYSFHSWQ